VQYVLPFSLAMSAVMVWLVIHLVARMTRPRRLFFVHLGRELSDADRARARRLALVNHAICVTSMALSFLAPHNVIALIAVLLLPFVAVSVLLAEYVSLARTIESGPEPRRFVIPLGEQASLSSYLSAPLQAAHIALITVTSVVFVWLVHELPAKVPMHWNIKGQADRIGRPTELWMFLGIMIFNLLIVWAVAWSVTKERWVLPPEQTERYAELQRERRGLIVRMVDWMMLAINVSIGLMWIGLAIGSMPGQEVFRSGGMIASLTIMTVAIGWPLWSYLKPLLKVQEQLREIAGSEVLGTHADGWKAGGLIYYAPGDPAVFVPKKIGIGQTLNFARAGAWLFIGAITLLPIVITVVVLLLAR